MARRKKSSENAVNLFSFQDVLACLTGVLIMVSLLLVIDGLSNTMNMTKGAQPEAAPADAAARIDQLTQDVAVLKKQLDDRKGGIDITKKEVDILDDRARQMAEEADRTRRRADALRAEIEQARAAADAAQADAAQAKEQLAAARRSEKQAELRERVRFRAGAQYSKTPVFVEVGSRGLSVGELDAERTPVLLAALDGSDAENRLQGAMGRRTPDASYVVFVVHEDAIPRFLALRDAVFRRGYEVGWQLWDNSAAGGFLDGAEKVGGAPGAAPVADAKPASAPPSAKGATP